jgi:hypothetical protein
MLSTAPLIASIPELLQRVMSARSDGERLTLGGRAALQMAEASRPVMFTNRPLRLSLPDTGLKTAKQD